MNINKLERLIEESKLSKQVICKECNFTRPTLNNALLGGDIKISTLKSLSDFFKVSVGYFFDEAENKELSNELAECKKEIQRLNDIISYGKNETMFLAIPIDTAKEFLDLSEMRDKIIRVLGKWIELMK